MPKRGPVAQPERRRLHRFNVYFSDAELDRLEVALGIPGLAATVKSKGRGVRRGQKAASTRMRQLALNTGARPVPVANREAFLELGRVGANLRQIAQTVLNEPHQAELIEAILEELGEFRTALLAVRIRASTPEAEVDPFAGSPGTFGELLERACP